MNIYDKTHCDLDAVMMIALELYAGADCGKNERERTAHKMWTDTHNMFHEFITFRFSGFCESYEKLKKMLASVKKSVDYFNIKKLDDAYKRLEKDVIDLKNGGKGK